MEGQLWKEILTDHKAIGAKLRSDCVNAGLPQIQIPETKLY